MPVDEVDEAPETVPQFGTPGSDLPAPACAGIPSVGKELTGEFVFETAPEAEPVPTGELTAPEGVLQVGAPCVELGWDDDAGGVAEVEEGAEADEPVGCGIPLWSGAAEVEPAGWAPLCSELPEFEPDGAGVAFWPLLPEGELPPNGEPRYPPEFGVFPAVEPVELPGRVLVEELAPEPSFSPPEFGIQDVPPLEEEEEVPLPKEPLPELPPRLPDGTGPLPELPPRLPDGTGPLPELPPDEPDALPLLLPPD